MSEVTARVRDERLTEYQGVRGMFKNMGDRIRAGELGFLPVIIGLVIIWTIFGTLNSAFLSPTNLSNLLMQSAGVGTIALGVVCVLLVGNIDLSVGSISGLSAAILATVFVKMEMPVILAILAAVGAAMVIGVFYSFIYLRFGVPAFVITLAGLLAFRGMKLWVLGTSGSINLPYDSFLVRLGQTLFIPKAVSYVIIAVISFGILLFGLGSARRVMADGLPTTLTTMVFALT